MQKPTEPGQKPLKPYSLKDMEVDAEARLRKAVEKYKQACTAPNLKEVQRQALRMAMANPDQGHRVVPLLESLMDRSTPPPAPGSPTKLREESER